MKISVAAPALTCGGLRENRVEEHNFLGPEGASWAGSITMISWPTVSIGTPYGIVTVTVEIAATPETIRYGLMHRDHLAWGAGMLFVMGADRPWSFYMRNTRVPLDMIFINRDRVVVGVIANAVPFDETWRGVDVPSCYVLEVNAGWAAAHGVVAGSLVRFDGMEIGSRLGPAPLLR